MDPVIEGFEVRITKSLDFELNFSLDQERFKNIGLIRASFDYDMPEWMLKVDPCEFVFQDFDSLDTQPSKVEMFEDYQKVDAIWHIPEEIVLDYLKGEEKERLIKNLAQHLGKLRLCTLTDIQYEPDTWRLISEEYLERFYRKKQFLKML